MTLSDILPYLHDPVVKYYLSVLLVLYPAARIFRRAGFSCLWSALLLAPFIGLMLCMMVLAARRWKLGMTGSIA